MIRRWKSWLLLTLSALAVLFLLWYAFMPQPVDVELARATRGPLRVTVDEDGRTRIRERYVVSSPLAGRVLRIELHPGDPVEPGKTLLATIEPNDPALLDERAQAEAEARVKAAEATRELARVEVDRTRQANDHAKSELARAEQLLASRAITREELELRAFRERSTAEEQRSALVSVQIAEFELEQARAALLRTRPRSPGEESPPRLEVRCPIHGQVLRVFQESATVVTPGTRLVEVGDPADLEIEIDVLSSDAVKITTGAKVWLEHWGGDSPLLAEVRLVEPAAFTKISALGVEEQRVWVIANFIDPRDKRPTLGDAYRVEARIVTWERPEVLKIPAGALFRWGDEFAVFTVADGRAKRTTVRSGHSNGLETEILEGLDEGATVILYPSDRIRDGIRVSER